MVLILFALILLWSSYRWYAQACEEFATYRPAWAWFHLLGSMLQMALAALLCLALVAAKAQVSVDAISP